MLCSSSAQSLTADGETSWRLLFDIALSHGQSLKLQRLTLAGLNVFLRSAHLMGPETGVYPLLVSRLWHQHSRPLEESAQAALFGAAERRKGADSEEEEAARNTVGLEGFTDIMNVVSVRCYQAEKLSRLRAEKEEDAVYDLRKAITLSAEDHVRLEKSVEYTADKFLKSFIFKSTVHPSSVIRLEPPGGGSGDTWTLHTRRLARYVVETLRTSVVVPLFHAFSGTCQAGCMTRAEYETFVHQVFPHFTMAQQAGAMSIFDFAGLADLQPLLGLSTLESVPEAGWTSAGNCLKAAAPQEKSVAPAADAVPASLLHLPSGAEGRRAPPVLTPLAEIAPSPHGMDRAPLKSPKPRLIGLDSFVDAMLMLSVVAFADEKAFPRHRPITAKVWSTFVDFYCPAAALQKGFSLAAGSEWLPDPLFLSEASAGCRVTPTLSQVHPQRVPVENVSSLLLGGLALRVDPTRCVSWQEADEVLAAQRAHGLGGPKGLPPRLLRDPVVAAEGSPSTQASHPQHRSAENSMDLSDKAIAEEGREGGAEEASATFMTGVTASGRAAKKEDTDVRTATGVWDRGGKMKGNSGADGPVATQAAALFTEELNQRSRRARSSSSSPSDTASLCHVFVDEEDVPCVLRGPNVVEALLPPCTWQCSLKLMKLRVDVEILPHCQTSGAAARVAYTRFRRVPVSLRDPTGERVFSSKDVTLTLDTDEQDIPTDILTRLQSVYESHVAAGSDAAPPALSSSALAPFAVAAGLVRAPDADDTVRAAMALAEVGDKSTVSFCDVLAVVAMLPCTPQLGGDAYRVPQLVPLLRVACSRRDPPGTVAEAGRAGAAPYSDPVEVPFRAAFQSKATAAKELADRKENVFKELQEAREQLRAERQGAGEPRRVLPPFPSRFSTNALFTRRLADRCGGATSCAAEQELRAVAKCVQTEFIQRRLVIEPFMTAQRADSEVSPPGHR